MIHHDGMFLDMSCPSRVNTLLLHPFDEDKYVIIWPGRGYHEKQIVIRSWPVASARRFGVEFTVYITLKHDPDSYPHARTSANVRSVYPGSLQIPASDLVKIHERPLLHLQYILTRTQMRFGPSKTSKSMTKWAIQQYHLSMHGRSTWNRSISSTKANATNHRHLL